MTGWQTIDEFSLEQMRKYYPDLTSMDGQLRDTLISSMEESDSSQSPPGSPVRDAFLPPCPSSPLWFDLSSAHTCASSESDDDRPHRPMRLRSLDCSEAFLSVSVKDRNRLAAAKYRAKNKIKMAGLEQEVRVLLQENRELRERVKKLMERF